MTDLTETIADWRENGTPGPWEMSRENHLDGTAEVVFSNHARDKMSKEWLSDAWFAFARAWVRQRGSDVDYPTGKANAALIAAAPDMADRIEALENLLTEIRDLRVEHRDHVTMDEAEAVMPWTLWDAVLEDIEAMLGERKRP